MVQQEIAYSGSKRRSSAWKDADKFKKIFAKRGPEDFPLYIINNGKNKLMKMLPDPPSTPLGDHMTYDCSSEPKFDPKIHVSLEAPKNIAVFDEGSTDEFKTKPFGEYKCTPNRLGCQFAYSDAFQFLSDEGTKVAREILSDMKKCAMDNGRSNCVRGIWHMSPYFKDMMLCDEVLDHFERIIGEPVLPNFYLYNTQINVGKVGGEGPVDQWHFDSVNYVAVTLLSNITGMKGGELELVKQPKQKAIDMVVNESYTPKDILKVSYERMGKCILAQGSKLIHHVTRVESAPEDRISLIMSLAPRNAYHPEVTIFHSMKNLDMNAPKGVAEYEFFRQKAWHCREILDDYVETEGFTTDKSKLADKLRAVAEELTRAADLVDGKISDKIGFFAEKGQEGSKWLSED